MWNLGQQLPRAPKPSVGLREPRTIRVAGSSPPQSQVGSRPAAKNIGDKLIVFGEQPRDSSTVGQGMTQTSRVDSPVAEEYQYRRELGGVRRGRADPSQGGSMK